MVEVDVAVPVFLRMAGIAGRLEFDAMRVGGTMAGDAVGAQFLLGRDRGVAGVAIELLVHADQRKLGARQVIIGHRLPDQIFMAIVALLPEAPGVRIVSLVAAVAVLGNLVLHVAAAVAADTINLRMTPEQRESGLLLVVELRCLPVAGGMALAAISTAIAAMDIVGGVATRAGFWGRLVLSTEVAPTAADRLVMTGQ